MRVHVIARDCGYMTQLCCGYATPRTQSRCLYLQLRNLTFYIFQPKPHHKQVELVGISWQAFNMESEIIQEITPHTASVTSYLLSHAGC